MSIEEIQKDIAAQKQQQTLTVSGGGAATDEDGRRKSVHDHHPSVALLEKNEHHVERRKEALLKHAGYQVDPIWWDNKLKLVKKAQAAHHKVMNSISMDHPEISIGNYGAVPIVYDSDEDDEPTGRGGSGGGGSGNNNMEKRNSNSATEIYHGDAITPRLVNDDSKNDSNAPVSRLKFPHFDPTTLSETEREQFETQKRQLESVLKNFDKLAANYEHATANLEILSKIAFDKEDKKNEIKELDSKFTKELNIQNEKISKINNNVMSLETSMKEINDKQSKMLENMQMSIGIIGDKIEETRKIQSEITTMKQQSNNNDYNNNNVNDNISVTLEQNNKELNDKLDKLIQSMNNSFKTVTNQMNNMSQNMNKSMSDLSTEVENISTMQNQLQQEQEKQKNQQSGKGGNSFQTSDDQEPLLTSKKELEPDEYFLKRHWCCGLVCLTHACGCGANYC